MMRTKKLRLIDVLTYSAAFFLWFAASFDPIGLVGIRYPALIFAICILAIKAMVFYKSVRVSSQYRVMFLFFVVYIPLYGLILCLLRGGMDGRFIDTSYTSSALYFICSLLYFDDRLDIATFIRIAILVLRMQCLVIYSCLILVLSGRSYDLIYTMMNHGLMFFGERQYGGISFPYLYLITSPMLILLIAYDSWRLFEKKSVHNILLLLVSSVALFLSGTRAHMVVSTIGIVFLWLWYRYRSVAFFHTVSLLIVFTIALTAMKPAVISDMLSPTNISNATKIAYLDTYSKIFNDTAALVFGQGYNAHVWSDEFSSMVNYGTASKTELTYLEYIRVFGLVGLLPLSIVFYITSKRFAHLSKRYQWVCPAIPFSKKIEK